MTETDPTAPAPAVDAAPAPVVDPGLLTAIIAALAAQPGPVEPAPVDVTSAPGPVEPAPVVDQASVDKAPGVTPVQVDTAPAPTAAPARPVVGDLVSYQILDVVTGCVLSGAGVVVRIADTGPVRVAPLSAYLLDVAADQVIALPAGQLDPTL